MCCVCHCIRNCLFFRLNGLCSIVAVIFVSFGRCNLCVRCLRCHQHLLHHQLRWINVINEPSNPKRIIRPICVDNEFIHWFGCFCSMSSEFAIHWTSMYWFLSCIEWTTRTRMTTINDNDMDVDDVDYIAASSSHFCLSVSASVLWDLLLKPHMDISNIAFHCRCNCKTVCALCAWGRFFSSL